MSVSEIDDNEDAVCRGNRRSTDCPSIFNRFLVALDDVASRLGTRIKKEKDEESRDC